MSTIVVAYYGDRVSEIREDLPPDAKYVRSSKMWRVPIVHLVESSWDFVSTCDDSIIHGHTTACNYSYDGTSSNLYDEVPDGMEICQTCVEAIEFNERRERERKAPNRRAYNDRTRQLLNSVRREQ
jgi:hypothetical protein